MVAGNAGTGEYQMTAKCGDLTITILCAHNSNAIKVSPPLLSAAIMILRLLWAITTMVPEVTGFPANAYGRKIIGRRMSHFTCESHPAKHLWRKFQKKHWTLLGYGVYTSHENQKSRDCSEIVVDLYIACGS